MASYTTDAVLNSTFHSLICSEGFARVILYHYLWGGEKLERNQTLVVIMCVGALSPTLPLVSLKPLVMLCMLYMYTLYMVESVVKDGSTRRLELPIYGDRKLFLEYVSQF